MKIKEFLKDNILLFDGSMGTLFTERCSNYVDKCEEGSLTHPDIIEDIHKEYIAAGAKAIKTNTFGANKIVLECDLARVQRIITASWNLAVKAVGDEDVFVFADIGPIPSIGDVGYHYKEIIDIFLDLGAKNFLFETFSASEPILQTAKYIKEKCPDAFIMGSFAINPDGYSAQGESGRSLLEKVSESEFVDAAGFNCVSGPSNLKKLIRQVHIGERILGVMPNAGFPTVIGRRTVFSSDPAYFAENMAEIASYGVKIIGGCCGTSPEFINETSKRIKAIKKNGISAVPKSEKPEVTEVKKAQHRKQTFLQKLERGEKIIAVELDPPVNSEFDKYLNGASKLNSAGADIITIADCPVARSRMDSSIIACKLKRELGIEPLPHMTCRDRNLNATKALLLGLNMEGIDQVLVVTGDPVPNSEKDSVKSVYNFNSRMLMSYIRELNEEIFENPFYICGALNINARGFDAQLRLAEKKVENGVKMLFTQPVLSEQAMVNLKRAKDNLDAKIMGGIMPVVSYRNACFMNNEISGITVSEEIVQQYRDKDKEECTRLAVQISSQIAKDISDSIHGYYIITPFNRTDIVSDIIASIKKGSSMLRD